MNFTVSAAPKARNVALVLIAALLVLGMRPAPAAAQCGAAPKEGFTMLFDGTARSLAGWTQSGPGGFQLQADCSIKSTGGLGLLWYSAAEFDSYTLRLDWKLDKLVDNSGVFVGFPAAGANTHGAAISKGYEVQIDQVGRNDGQSHHITGAIFDIQGPNRDTRLEGTDSRGWNTYEITVDAPKIVVELNGTVVNEFTSRDIARDISRGQFGLQNHGGPDTTYFRNVQVKAIEPGSVSGGDTGAPAPIATTGPFDTLRNNDGIAEVPMSGASFDGGGSAYSEQALSVGDPAGGYPGVDPGERVSKDGFELTWPKVAAGEPDNVSAAGQTITMPAQPGATKIGFFGAAAGGSAAGEVVLNYSSVDAAGQTQRTTKTVNLAFSDWTRGLTGDAPLQADEQVVLKTRARSGVVFFTTPHVFLVTLPLESGLTLDSVTLPSTPNLHLFGVDTK